MLPARGTPEATQWVAVWAGEKTFGKILGRYKTLGLRKLLDWCNTILSQNKTPNSRTLGGVVGGAVGGPAGGPIGSAVGGGLAVVKKAIFL